MISLFGPGKKSHEQAEAAAKADLEAAANALEAAKKAKETTLAELGGDVDALAARFAASGEPGLAKELSVARGILADVEAWHLAKIEELATAKTEAEERHKTASGTATAARLLAETVTRSKNLAVLNKRLEGVLAAIRKAPLSELQGSAMPELKDPFILTEVERLMPEVLGAESDLLAVVRTGISAYGLDPVGVARALNVPASELFDARQFEFYSLAEQLLGDLLAAIKAAHEDIKKRGAEDEKAASRKEQERLRAEEARLLAKEREEIAASLQPGIDRLDEVSAEHLQNLTPDRARERISAVGWNRQFADAARDRLIAARQAARSDGKPLPPYPHDEEWCVVLARRGLLWSRVYQQFASKPNELIDEQVSVDDAMSKLVDRELRERRKAAA